MLCFYGRIAQLLLKVFYTFFPIIFFKSYCQSKKKIGKQILSDLVTGSQLDAVNSCSAYVWVSANYKSTFLLQLPMFSSRIALYLAPSIFQSPPSAYLSLLLTALPQDDAATSLCNYRDRVFRGMLIVSLHTVH